MLRLKMLVELVVFVIVLMLVVPAICINHLLRVMALLLLCQGMDQCSRTELLSAEFLSLVP